MGNVLVWVPPETDPDTRIWVKPFIWEIVPGAQ